MHSPKPVMLPHWNGHSITQGAWGGKSTFKNLEFYNFAAATRQGAKQFAITITKAASDYIPMQDFENIKFINVEHGAVTELFEPPDSWINISDCGDFACTAPKNALFSFKNTELSGDVTPDFGGFADFQIAPSVEGYTSQIDTCTQESDWNAYRCNVDGLGVLLFESEDPDQFDRSMQPIYLQMNDNEATQNKLNAYMDHVWDGFYTGQIRRSRFPGFVWGKEGMIYQIIFTGTPAKRMRFKFNTQSETAGMTVRIHYPSAESRQVEKDGEAVEYNSWVKEDGGKGDYGPIEQRFCGENRFTGVTNILEFYINSGCELKVAPRDAIQTTVRLEWTMDTFFSSGGTTAFVDRLCASLGIHASTVKSVRVYEGSVGVDYEIIPAADEPMSLEQIRSRQTEQFATGTLDLGAPILDVTQGAAKIVSDGVTVADGFERKILVPTATNAGDQVWIEWIQPILWYTAQIASVDAPAMLIYNFNSLGLVWLWNNLAQEIQDMAEAQGFTGSVITDIVAPTEGNGPIDSGEADLDVLPAGENNFNDHL